MTHSDAFHEIYRAICRDCGVTCEYGYFWVIGEDIFGDPEVLCEDCFSRDNPVL